MQKKAKRIIVNILERESYTLENKVLFMLSKKIKEYKKIGILCLYEDTG